MDLHYPCLRLASPGDFDGVAINANTPFCMHLKEIEKAQTRQQVISQFAEMAYTDYLCLSLREQRHGIRAIPFAFRSQCGHGRNRRVGRERFAAGRFIGRVDANRTLANGKLEFGSQLEQVWTRLIRQF